jgi:hypothetical protein
MPVADCLPVGPSISRPTSASWLNAVEGFFAILAKRRLKRGIFKGVVDLQAAINRFILDHNQQPKPFTWTADPDQIIAAAARTTQAENSSLPRLSFPGRVTTARTLTSPD